MSYSTISTLEVFRNTPILAGATATSGIIYLDNMKLDGKFSLQYAATGTGVLTFFYRLSNDGITFSEEDSITSIVAGVTADSGFIKFDPAIAKAMIIETKETGATAPANATAIVCFK